VIIKRLSLFLIFIFTASSVQSSIDPKIGISLEVPVSTTMRSLDYPLKQRIQSLRQQGDSGYNNLNKMAFSKELHMSIRWRALTSMAILRGKKSLPELIRAVELPAWFMRNAALIGMQRADLNEAKRWARKLLDDKALIVRSAAVRNIKKLNDRRSSTKLWQTLNNKNNYYNGRSLFIRRQIVETLGQLSRHGEEKKFIKILYDTDPRLYAPAIAALERLTGHQFGKKNEPIQYKSIYWKQWASNKYKF